MIALDRVRPGDVLLVGGSSLTSTAIKALTGGVYSHAAIFITNSILFEAVGDGLGFVVMDIHDILQVDSRTQVTGAYPSHLPVHDLRPNPGSLSEALGNRVADALDNSLHTPFKSDRYTKFKVLRLKKLEKCTPESIARQLVKVAVNNWGMRYPALSKLLRALPAFRKLPEMSRISRMVNPRSGYYCSQLVLSMLESIDVWQRDEKYPDNNISPSELARMDAFEVIDCTPQPDGVETDACGDLQIDFMSRKTSPLDVNLGRTSMAWLFDKFHSVDFKPIIETDMVEAIDKATAPPDGRLDARQVAEITWGVNLVLILNTLTSDWRIWLKIVDAYHGENPFQDISDEVLKRTGMKIV